MRQRLLPATLVLAELLFATSVLAQNQTCTSEQFRKVVDDTGAVLRKLNADSQPRMEAGFRRLKDKHSWAEREYQEKAIALLSDPKSDRYDATAGELLGRLDRLAEEARSGTDCSRLAELESTSLELQATIRVKTQYMLTRIDALLGDPKSSTPVQSAAPVPPPVSAPAPTLTEPPSKAQSATSTPQMPAQSGPSATASTASTTAPSAPKPPSPAAPAAPKTAAGQTSGWATTSRIEPPPGPPVPSATPQPYAPPAPSKSSTAIPSAPVAALPPTQATGDSYTIDEIKDASKGFFGTISTGLASVIEHAFSKLGRPNAYVLGSEGGGAFIAGVRYGSGTLYTRGGRTREVFWHGPSIGYDFGASGAKTLFLVYNLRDELDIFAGFSGVEGSAFLVGGVGMTILTDSKVVMAPIRSGVGLRLGASIGYVRFTPRATWNPF